jgi:hypothetical protein
MDTASVVPLAARCSRRAPGGALVPGELSARVARWAAILFVISLSVLGHCVRIMVALFTAL